MTLNLPASVRDGFASGESAYFDISLPSLTVTTAFEAQLGAGNGASDTSTFTTATAAPCAAVPVPRRYLDDSDEAIVGIYGANWPRRGQSHHRRVAARID
jgi:hypothetical protein